MQHVLQPDLVIQLPLVHIGEDLVCLGDFLELLGRGGIVLVLVGVPFEGGLSVCFLDFIWCCIGFYP